MPLTPSSVAVLLARFGRAVTLYHRTPGTMIAASGRASAPTESADAATGVVRGYRADEIDGDTIEVGDLHCMIAATDLVSAPETDDHLAIGSDRWNVLDVRTFEVLGTALAYDLHLRRVQ